MTGPTDEELAGLRVIVWDKPRVNRTHPDGPKLLVEPRPIPFTPKPPKVPKS